MANSVVGCENQYNSYICTNLNDTQMNKEITETTIRICQKVREVRNQMGMSQGEVARTAGLHRQAVTRLESAEVSPSIDLLARTLEPMGYTVDIVPIETIDD